MALRALRAEEDGLEGGNLPARLAADLDDSFESMVLLYQDRLYGFALSFCGNPQDAEEAAQDTFVRAYRALQGYEPERVRALALRPWLYQIALNVCRNRARGRRLRLVQLDGSPDGSDGRAGIEPSDGEARQPELVLERAEHAEELTRRVAALPQRYKAAVALRYIEDLSYAEAAQVLGQPVGTVKANAHRGVRLLREAMLGRSSEERYSYGKSR